LPKLTSPASYLYSPDSQRPSFQAAFLHQATIDYWRYSLAELPASYNRDDHLVWTLVAARYSALYIPPHQFSIKRRLRQPQRLLQADFVLQARRCLSLADNALSLSLVTLYSV
jgi:hypothetical protein